MDTQFRSPNAGTVYDKGKLYLFDPNSIRVLKAWPPMAWRKMRDKPNWTHFRPEVSVPRRDLESRIRHLETPAEEDGQLLLPWARSPHQKELAWLRWYTTIPIEMRDAVWHFPERQWHMLSFLARCGDAALDLTLSNPALAFSLACNPVYHRPAVQRPLSAARAQLRRGKRQRDILAWLGFPGSEAARKLLAKIIHKAISVPALLYLRQSMYDQSMFKALSHLQRVNRGALRVATDSSLIPLAAPTLLDEISHHCREDKKAKAAYILRDSLTMHRLLFPNTTFPGPIRHLRQLLAIHDDLTQNINRARYLHVDVPFPSPPIQGSDSIVPITTANELIEEGKLQQNCVASYIERVVVHRRIYIYRVLQPERCTLSLVRCGKRWILSELLGASNKQPSSATRRRVEDWLALAMGKLVEHQPLQNSDDVPF